MPTIKIDDVDYDTEKLSDEAKNQLVNLQVVDQKLAALKQEVAIMQTARQAYANALKTALPSGE